MVIMTMTVTDGGDGCNGGGEMPAQHGGGKTAAMWWQMRGCCPAANDNAVQCQQCANDGNANDGNAAMQCWCGVQCKCDCATALLNGGNAVNAAVQTAAAAAAANAAAIAKCK